MKVSELKPYSIGTVAANKPLKTNIIDVVPSEDVSFVNGELTADTDQETVESSDQAGSSYQVSLNSSNAIKAEWLPMGGSNRITAPDVRRGESVVLYRFADVDKFYWTTLKDDMKLRKLETVIYAFSGTKKESDGVGPETYYYLEISTHRKLIHFHSSKKNGEPFGYDIQINTGEGFIKIQDDAGNFFILDSKEKQIAMKNTDGSYMDLNKKSLTINVPETVSIKAKNMVVNVDQTIASNATNIATKASANIQESAPTITIQGDAAVSVTSPSTTIV